MNRIFSIILGACLFLVSCGKGGIVASDGYYFEKETWTHTSFDTEIVLIQTEQELLDQAAKHGKTNPPGREIFAFSAINPISGKCTIYMIDPKKSYNPEEYGHELTHCIYGLWHNNQP